MPKDAVRTMFFYNTTADYAGKGIVQGSEQVNFVDYRERNLTGPPKKALKKGRRTVVAAVDRGSEGARALLPPSQLSPAAPTRSTLSAAAPSSLGLEKPRRQRWDGLTAYSQGFYEKPMDGRSIDTEFRMAITKDARGRDKVSTKGTYSTCYGRLCGDRSDGQGALEAPFLAEDSGLKSLISPGGESEGCPMESFASTQHRAPPKELIFGVQTCYPMDQIGRVPKAADFFKTESRRTYSQSAVGQAPPPLQRANSAPSVGLGLGSGRLRAVAEELGPERVFRQTMMTSQYGQTISRASPLSPPPAVPPNGGTRGGGGGGAADGRSGVAASSPTAVARHRSRAALSPSRATTGAGHRR